MQSWLMVRYNLYILRKVKFLVFEAIDMFIKKGGYKGYDSFEWEKLWHPGIEEPELAFAGLLKGNETAF